MGPWLLLVPQLPARPAYLRVKLWRRLREIGAVSLKNAVYVLPDRSSSVDQFRALLRELERAGGSGHICEAKFADGDAGIRALFEKARDADYRALEKELRRLMQLRKIRKPDLDLKLAKIRHRLERLTAIDFFEVGQRSAVRALLTQLEHSHIVRQDEAPVLSGVAALKNRQWVTRRNIHVDRIACAWLVRRFIDPDARFCFVPDRHYRARAGELRFDMPGGEFTHQGDQCSFEVLLAATGLSDIALTAIAEMVHDLDIEDGKFARPEAAGIGLAIGGICATQAADADRIARGCEMLDGIYARLRNRRQA